MNWFYVIFLYLSVQFCSPTPQHNNHRNGYEIAVAMDKGKSSAVGCLHNDTMFAETSIVPTSEPCLVCKCSKRNLLCVRRVCKDQPYPPPRGCILVYKKSLCCPYLSCSKYHVNFYKNAERNRERHGENNYHQATQEKSAEKHYRHTDDDDTEEMNGGCIESGSLYASGSAMHRSSASMCTYCYCINGQQKCIKPKCMLRSTKCKPIFMEASCCPIKYDCNNNGNSSAIATSTSGVKHQHGSGVNKFALVKRKNRSNGCVVEGRQFGEGERLPHDDGRPCEVCYCIKGMRKCAVKKCAPVIRGCVPKIPTTGSCCPTSYDCRRSMKFKRESRQENEEEEAEEEEDTDTIDFFSLLFGSDEPKETEKTTAVTPQPATSTTLPPFKALPSTTESSFFDLIRAGLEMIDANADKIDSHLNSIVPTTTEGKSLLTSHANELESSSITPTLPSKSVSDEGSSSSTTTTVPSTTVVTKSSTLKTSPPATKVTAARKTTTTTKAPKPTTASVKLSPPPATTPSTAKSTSAKVNSQVSTTPVTAPPSTVSAAATTTRKSPPATTKRVTTKRPTTTTTVRTTSSKKYIVPSILQSQQLQRIPVQFSANVLPDTKLNAASDDNEADTLPNLEIIPFVAHDAIKTDQYEPYRPTAVGAGTVPAPPVAATYDNLEKDYFAGEKGGEKPFRYNNKFIHHNYEDTLDYVYTNPHERIDTGPYYFETNENQFEAFSPPSEQDFLGGFSPKESIYDEVPSTSANYDSPLKRNDYAQKPLDTTTATAVPASHGNKSNLTSSTVERSAVTAAAAAAAINQTREQEQSTVPSFKKISTNFTSFIDDLLQANALEETTKAPVSSSSRVTTRSSTSAPIKSIINDDDFIIKHLRASTSTAPPTTTTVKRAPASLMEIFAKPTNPTMNGLLKLAGCNIYGQMYEVGHVIEELSNRCLECKCLPDIGVGCVPLNC